MRRRRECPACDRRFTTFERLQETPLYVVKRDGGQEPFDREKLRRALLGATHKRAVARSEIERIVTRIEAELVSGEGGFGAEQIGRLVLAELRELDYGAYLQFAGTMPGVSESVNPEIAASAAAGSVRFEEHGS